MHPRSNRDRDRHHLGVRRRHLGEARIRHRHQGRHLDVRHLHRRLDGRQAGPHLRDERLEAHEADRDAELRGEDRLGSADGDRPLRRDVGHPNRHPGACPGSRRTGCCPGANGPCPGWMRRGCCRDGDLDEVHGDAESRGLRLRQPAQASRRQERRDAERWAWVRRSPRPVLELRAQQELASRLEQPVRQEQALACASGQASGPTMLPLAQAPQVPQVPLERKASTGPASFRGERSMALLHPDAVRRASMPRAPQPVAARFLRRCSSAPREVDGPPGARRSKKRSLRTHPCLAGS